MALVLADRVLETTTTSGSGTISLAGASVGYQGFSTGVGNGNQTYYTIASQSATEWEVGIGTYTSVGDTLSRDTVLASSAGGAKVGFSAGTKQVFVTYPAGKSVFFTESGTISANSGTITDVATPVVAGDAVNKQYVDDLVASGITYHTPVKYEVPDSTGNLVATYNNGTAGVSATLTNAGTLAAFVPDGTTATISDRILIYNQTNAFENGVYTVTTVGDGSTAWVLTRAADADSYALKDPNALGSGDAFFITSGNTGAGETYVCNTTGTIVFGTTAINFVQVSSTQIYAGGNGITISGPTISLQTPVTVPNGGTGISTAPASGELLTGNGTGYSLNTLKSGTGISVANAPGSITITNTAPDQTVVLTGSTAISVTGTYPSFSITNTAPNQSVTISAGTGIAVGGGYPSFTISSTAVDGPILESEITIDQNYTLTTGKNGLSVGPVTISPGYNVTVPAGQTWMVINQASGSGGGTIATVGKAIAISIVFGG
jgi:hypothetical protein